MTLAISRDKFQPCHIIGHFLRSLRSLPKTLRALRKAGNRALEYRNQLP